MSSENRFRFPAERRSVTVPVNIDQNARRIMAVSAQNLYLLLLNMLESRVSFLLEINDDDVDVDDDECMVDIGRGSSSLIASRI